MKVIVKDLSHLKDQLIDDTCEGCGGGYYDSKEDIIYVDANLPLAKQKLVVAHEVLEMYLSTQIEHYFFDIIGRDILGGLEQLL